MGLLHLMVSSQCKKAPGGLIQEGADNIDLNTETIDGKDTFHSMARACLSDWSIA